MKKAGVPLPQVCTADEEEEKDLKGDLVAKDAGKEKGPQGAKAPLEPEAQTAAPDKIKDKKSEVLPDKVTLFQVDEIYISVYERSLCY